MQEIIATGKTAEEAVEQACAQLGLTRDDISVEVLEIPQKKLFGMSPAKVRVTPNEGAFKVADLLKEPEPPAQTTQQPRPPQPPRQHTHRENKPAYKPLPEIQPEDIEFESLLVPDDQLKEITEQELPVSAIAALAYFREVSGQMGAGRLEYRFYETDRGVKFSIDGEDSSLVIGRRGETMDALQYLCMLVSSRADGDYCKIMVDVAQYRKKREKTLQALAVREANKVKKTRYNQTLEPMNPYERRIVHSAVQQIEGVKSESVGTEPNRRVAISLISGGKGTRRRRDNRDNRDTRGNRSGNRNGGRDSRPPQKPRQAPPNHPADAGKSNSDDESAVLYGRIDL